MVSQKAIIFSFFEWKDFCVLIVLFFLVASCNSYIDDTDETFGYWEPLHYLLYGHGMQTWEYSPDFAIRTYTFIFPFRLFGEFFKVIGLSKPFVFLSIKVFLGFLTSISQLLTLRKINQLFGKEIFEYTTVFLLCSPGIFFSSSAYLPSAICSNFVMLSLLNCLNQTFVIAIFWGCAAVLWTGWPFIGALFLPVGIYILYKCFFKKEVFQICCFGMIILIITVIPVILIDFHYYQKRTFPPLNIFLYNTSGDNLDELYGVAPISYYLKNLILNLGLVFPLALLLPVIMLVKKFANNSLRKKKSYVCSGDVCTLVDVEDSPQRYTNVIDKHMSEVVLVLASTGIWLVILFSRPHKEERFLYPVFGSLCILAALTMGYLQDMLLLLPSHITTTTTTTTTSTSVGDQGKNIDIVPSPPSPSSTPSTINTAANNPTCTNTSSNSNSWNVIKMSCFFLMILWGGSRIASCRRNYSGNMRLWQFASKTITLDSRIGPLDVCMGGDWYTFPSHFFLPDKARLRFVNDTFHGQLPQPYQDRNGTWAKPPQPFNLRNLEESSRYIDVKSCEYIVVTLPKQRIDEKTLTPFMKGIMEKNHFEFEVVATASVIDPSQSPVLTRSLFIPMLSNKYNSYFTYGLLKRKVVDFK